MQRTHPTLDQNHTLRQATHLMIDTATHTITVTADGKPTATVTIQDILDAVRAGKHTKTTRLADITQTQAPQKTGITNHMQQTQPTPKTHI